MSKIGIFDPAARPPDGLKVLHKLYQKASADALANDSRILDFNVTREKHAAEEALCLVRVYETSKLTKTFARFEGQDWEPDQPVIEGPRIHYTDSPGLQIVPSLLPKNTQRCLLARLLHRDLVNTKHKTNVHIHHAVPYDNLSSHEKDDANGRHRSPGLSFFNFSPECGLMFSPIDPNVHRPLTISQFLNRKLRWMTLGGQYDWTRKAYPEESPPDFPEDIAQLTQGLFPEIRPEAAIVNLYSPGDTLSIHRDVSEASDVGLVSISLGCDGIFIAALEDPSTKKTRHVVVRLRSGDAVYMSGPSRFAWHSMPRVLADTCPPWLRDWPANMSVPGVEIQESDGFEAWRGWMADKRINLNIRQMRD
ncbi:MAG: hypothetical protein Q9201_005186 [Fulgogasparrea decipioides]